eukprot:291373-Pleurochrysis_carterae.AAC.1
MALAAACRVRAPVSFGDVMIAAVSTCSCRPHDLPSACSAAPGRPAAPPPLNYSEAVPRCWA